ncbi:MAG: hypothetical protein IT379_39930 [Deltaproteobacteria bacterium]|nr:hypothetical protein [Deltaproteobacteria bacterium]
MVYLSSTGAAGSYAQAATNAAARVFLPGTTLGTGSVALWMRGSITAVARIVYVSADLTTSNSRLTVYVSTSSGGMVGHLGSNASGSPSVHPTQTGLVPSDWTLIVGTIAHTASDIAGISAGGANRTTGTDGSPDTYGAGEYWRLFASNTTTQLWAGGIRSPAVWSRVLSDAEIAELHTLGPMHDLSVSSGDYSGGGPDHWWEGTGDSGTTVTDVGSVGGCDLTLNGGVTIEEA